MARTDLTVQEVSDDGATVAFEAANVDGNMVTNRGDVAVLIHNASAGAITVTVPTPVTVGGRAVADDTHSVAAGTYLLVGEWDEGTHNQQSGADAGKVYINYSAVASVTVLAMRVA